MPRRRGKRIKSYKWTTISYTGRRCRGPDGRFAPGSKCARGLAGYGWDDFSGARRRRKYY